MSIGSIIIWAGIVGFWIGFAWRDWGYRRAARHEAPKSREQIAGEKIMPAIDMIKFRRRMIGPGTIQLQYFGEIEMSDGAKFHFIIQDQGGFSR